MIDLEDVHTYIEEFLEDIAELQEIVLILANKSAKNEDSVAYHLLKEKIASLRQKVVQNRQISELSINKTS
jgi:hypothetical protein